MVLSIHAGIGAYLHKERPILSVLPPVPSPKVADAISFGDRQLLYRMFALQLQNAGDGGGRITRMEDYNMREVIAWLGVLQDLDPRSHHYVALAVRYFAQVRNVDSLRGLVDFIDQDVAKSPEIKWYWQSQAVAIARDKMKDTELALKLSQKIYDYGEFVPLNFIWVLQMEPILYWDMGRIDEARRSMDRIVAAYGHKMNEHEKSWTDDFYRQLDQSTR